MEKKTILCKTFHAFTGKNYYLGVKSRNLGNNGLECSCCLIIVVTQWRRSPAFRKDIEILSLMDLLVKNFMHLIVLQEDYN